MPVLNGDMLFIFSVIENRLWSYRMSKFITAPPNDRYYGFIPQRNPGRPRMRWDDKHNALSRQFVGEYHWTGALIQSDDHAYKDGYVFFSEWAPV